MELLSKNNSDSLKGIFSIAVLLCHLCGRTGLGSQIGLGSIYTAMGYLSVSVFFCISGYGLAYSFMNRSNYLNNFIRKKIIPIFFLYVLFVLIYSLIKYFFLCLPDPIYTFISSFYFGKTVVSNGWYIQVILLCYCLTFGVYRFIKSESYRIILIIILFLVYISVCKFMGLSSFWYESSLCFPLGIILNNYKSRICESYLDNRKYYISIFLIFLFVISFVTYLLLGGLEISIIPKIISSITFASIIIFISHFINLQSRLTNFLSKIYLEIYLLQGMVFILLQNKFWSINNDYLYFICAFILTLVISCLSRPIFRKLLK